MNEISKWGTGHARQKGPPVPEFNSDWAHMSETVAKFDMCTLYRDGRRRSMLNMVAGFDISKKKRPGTRRQGRRGDARGLFQLRPWLSSSQYRNTAFPNSGGVCRFSVSICGPLCLKLIYPFFSLSFCHFCHFCLSVLVRSSGSAKKTTSLGLPNFLVPSYWRLCPLALGP